MGRRGMHGWARGRMSGVWEGVRHADTRAGARTRSDKCADICSARHGRMRACMHAEENAGSTVSAREEEEEAEIFGARGAALGQPVGPTAHEEKPGESSGFDWSLIRSSWFELNVELSIYVRKRI
ncbi:hypothetical protein CRG98_000307 [Punica granatum]|uniref:Uncharacterized protein n=1 Tax=Punica granatum TaxID=22663 RepID=A0A2I0LF61_PUNGR|nr:hypothetical protein CRG98_000307 [Punica granatum]